MLADGEVVARFTANGWRRDLEELRQGDGRWGFNAPFPASLRDGVVHRLELRLADNGPSVLPGSLDLCFQPIEYASPEQPVVPKVEERRRRAFRGRPELSIVVNFYNMRREAERTLQSLARTYQQGIEDLAYEVICIDNGSTHPLDAEWVASFGPEFRLVRPARLHSSPCNAINAAAAQARGRHLAIIIDGAHILTPGVLAEAMIHLRGTPASVVALRHWFIGGDQRWLSSAGYSRNMEDLLFDRIDWPTDGYQLFRIGSPIGESPNVWFDGLSESNCLFLPAELWRRIDGFDEAFDEPGGGFANLDLLRRAAETSKGGVTCLIGEATFHQYHGGTTTNVSDIEKDERVNVYERDYRELRGRSFEGLAPHEFRLAGAMRSEHAATTRQRPLFPAPLGVTDHVRPAVRRRLFDPGAERYLQAAYVEFGLHRTTRWLGAPVELAPTDLIALLEIMREVRPGYIVTTSVDPNLMAFVDSACQLLGLEGSGIIQVGVGGPLDKLPGRARVVTEDPWARNTLRKVEREIEAAEEVLVLFEPPAAPGAPVEALAAYASLVTYGSYIVYLGTARGQPWLGYSTQWPMKAIRNLTERSGRYAIDHTFDQHFVTTCPSGYIRRIGGLIEAVNYDPALDVLDAL